MKRMIEWFVEKQLERDRRREVRAMLRCFSKAMKKSERV